MSVSCYPNTSLTASSMIYHAETFTEFSINREHWNHLSQDRINIFLNVDKSHLLPIIQCQYNYDIPNNWDMYVVRQKGVGKRRKWGIGKLESTWLFRSGHQIGLKSYYGSSNVPQISIYKEAVCVFFYANTVLLRAWWNLKKDAQNKKKLVVYLKFLKPPPLFPSLKACF